MFFKKSLELLERKKTPLILKVFEISEKFDGRIIANMLKFSSSHSIEFILTFVKIWNLCYYLHVFITMTDFFVMH